jgi:hypothetical protein
MENKRKHSLLNAKVPNLYLIIQGTNDAVKMEEFDLLKKHFSKAKTRLFFSSFFEVHILILLELPEHTKNWLK